MEILYLPFNSWLTSSFPIVRFNLNVCGKLNFENVSLLEGDWLFGHPWKFCWQHGMPHWANNNVLSVSKIK